MLRFPAPAAHRKVLVSFLIALQVFVITVDMNAATAAETWLDGDVVHLRGAIVRGDADRLKKLMLGAAPAVQLVDVDSTGGNLEEGVEIALIVVQNRLPVRVLFGEVCYSSCFIPLAAAPRRLIDLPMRVGVHRLKAPIAQNAEAMNQRAADFFRQLGVSEVIIDKMMRTSDKDLTLLNEQEVSSLGPTDFHRLSDQDVARKMISWRPSANHSQPELGCPLNSSARLNALGNPLQQGEVEKPFDIVTMPTLGSKQFWEWFNRCATGRKQ